MKLVTFLLLLWVAALSASPCVDIAAQDPCCGKAHSQGQDEEKASGGDCAPFCICGCCHAPQINAMVTMTSFEIPALAVSMTPSPSRIFSYSQSLWHPPRD